MLTDKQIRNRAACKRWRDKNKEREAERQRQYIEDNRDFINKRQRNYRSQNKEKVKEFNKRAYRKRTPEGALLEGAKHRAKIKGLEFSLILEDIAIPEYCPVLNIRLEKSTTGVPWAHSPSIDRFDNSKGYTKDNIRVISHRANAIKGDATVKELMAVLNYMSES